MSSLPTYADAAFYHDRGGGLLTTDTDIANGLYIASRHIDILTFNRILERWPNRISMYQMEIIKLVCVQLADFEKENEASINSVLSSYSINGVSMDFSGGWNIFKDSGIVMPKSLYKLLESTGFTCRVFGR